MTISRAGLNGKCDQGSIGAGSEYQTLFSVQYSDSVGHVIGHTIIFFNFGSVRDSF